MLESDFTDLKTGLTVDILGRFMVENRYVMNPSPIPRFDNHKLHNSEGLYLFGAGREKKIYAIPPYTSVIPLAFDDVPFKVENFEGKHCRLCGATGVYLDEMYSSDTGEKFYECSDTGFCEKNRGANHE